MDEINREELSKLERAEYLAYLKETWAKLNPAARHGGDRRSAKVRHLKEDGDQGAILALCSEIAERAGLSRRAFFRAIAISCGLTCKTKARIWDTWLENHQAELANLATHIPEMQDEICDLLFCDPPKARNVADAVTLVRGGRLTKPVEQLYDNIQSSWARLPKGSKEAFAPRIKQIF